MTLQTGSFPALGVSEKEFTISFYASYDLFLKLSWPLFWFLHLTCQNFCSFLFSSSGTLQLLEFCSERVDKMGTDCFIRLQLRALLAAQVPLLGEGSSSTDFSHGCLRFWSPTAPERTGAPGNSRYCWAPCAVTTSASQSKGRQIKKKKQSVL